MIHEKKIRGYATVWEVDKQGDKVCKGSFSNSIIKAVPMLYRHHKGVEVGKWELIIEDEKGLYVEGKLDLEKCRQFKILAEVDRPLALSVGMRIKESKVSSKGVREIYDAELKEVSVLPRGEQICRSAVVFS